MWPTLNGCVIFRICLLNFCLWPNDNQPEMYSNSKTLGRQKQLQVLNPTAGAGLSGELYNYSGAGLGGELELEMQDWVGS